MNTEYNNEMEFDYVPQVGDEFPSFACKALIDTSTNFKEITNESYEGKWKVYFFWPKDFTFVCPTEIAGFGELESQFADANTQIIGCSTDSEYAHHSWKNSHQALRQITFPLMSDITKDLCSALNILDQEEAVAQRATYIVDPNNIIRFMMVTDMAVGRNPAEVLRVLKALQTSELCGCSWTPGDQFIQPK